MIDEEGMQIDIAEAMGKANAAICIQGAIVAMLVTAGVLSEADIATISGIASQALSGMEGVNDGAKELGQSALRGFAKTWTKFVVKN
jgi:hypothetical protein